MRPCGCQRIECNKIILRANYFGISKEILPWISKKAQRCTNIREFMTDWPQLGPVTTIQQTLLNSETIKIPGLWQEKVWTVFLSLWSPLFSNLLFYIYWICWQTATHFTYIIHRRAYQSIVLNRDWKSVNAPNCCALKLFQVQTIT